MERFKALGAFVFILVIASPALAVSDAWTIDTSHSSVQFSVRHMMVSNVRGEFGKVSGKVHYDGKALDTIQIEATIDTATIGTRSERRDTHLKSADFLDVDKYPTITFKSNRSRKSANGELQVIGDLTLKGVTKEVILNIEGPSPAITDQRGNQRMGATATTKINRKDFNVTWNRALDGGGVVVGDEVKITIDVELIKND
jgi:polyisoprenoid-binding protein YceI